MSSMEFHYVVVKISYNSRDQGLGPRDQELGHSSKVDISAWLGSDPDRSIGALFFPFIAQGRDPSTELVA